MKLSTALLLMALAMPSASFASDYSSGVDAIRNHDFASARASLHKGAERGHVLSQGRLALVHSDRDPNPLEALGWLLAAQDNGGRNLEADIARARGKMEGAPEEDAQGYGARFGRQATRKNWLPQKSDPEYDPCTTDREKKPVVSQPPQWEHAAITLINHSRDGRLVDVKRRSGSRETPATSTKSIGSRNCWRRGQAPDGMSPNALHRPSW